MDDRLGDLLRAARPSSAHRDDPLTPRALRELAAYEAAEKELPHNQTQSASRRCIFGLSPFSLVAGSAAAAMIAVTMLLASVFLPTPAVATTPPPPMLELTSFSGTASNLLEEMVTMRRDSASWKNTIRTQSWALNTWINNDGTIESSTVEPAWSETTFEEDGTVNYRLIAAEPFTGQDSDDLTEPGTVLADETFQLGEWGFTADKAPPTRADDIGPYLAELSGNPALTAGDAIREISGILSNYLLSNEQEAAIIEYLATLDTLTVAGETVDRLGRIGIVFSATDRSQDFEDLLIIAPQTGTILAVETMYIGSNRTDIASPSVVDYTAWER